MKELANFLFEVGMLQRTPRTGFQFLGSGGETVAEHILRTLFVGYTLCRLDGEADLRRVLQICLFHDLPEARTGDMNYVNKKYVTVDEEKAVRELAATLFFGDDIRDSIQEFNEKKTRESRIANDADQLSLILKLKECGDLGNRYSPEWISYACQRLCTESGRKLAAAILETDWTDWWFREKGDWWVNGNRG